MTSNVLDVAKDLQAKTASDIKEIYHTMLKDAVAAAQDDDESTTFMGKISDAIEIVAKKVMEGIEDVGEAIKEHPEMIAEGALAIAVRAATLVAPHILLPALAVVGKMAADSAIKTAKQIAAEHATEVVKDTSEELKKKGAADKEKAEQIAELTEEKIKEVIAENTADGEIGRAHV